MQCPNHLKRAGTSASARASTITRERATGSTSTRERTRASTATREKARVSTRERARARSSVSASCQELEKIAKFLHPPPASRI